MTKYVNEVADIFSNLDIQQIEFYAKKMSIDEVKILHVEILPQIMNLDRRRQLKRILIEREKQFDLSSEKDAVISSVIQQSQSISDQLKVLFENLTADVVLGLTTEAARNLFLKRATDDELFVLEHKLRTMSFDETVEALWIGLDAEKKSRKSTSEQPIVSPTAEKEAYKENWRTINGNLQWESGVWQNISKNIKQINLELTPPVQSPVEAAKREPGFLSKVGAVLARGGVGLIKGIGYTLGIIPYGLYQLGSYLFASKAQKTPQNTTVVPPLSKEEKVILDQMRLRGAQNVAINTGLTKDGGMKERDQEGIETTLHTRFGMVLASQMVSGTKNKYHRDLRTVIESLTQKDDDNATIEKVYAAIKGVLDDVDGNPLKGEHACSTGGFPDLVTAMESEVIGKLVQSPEAFQQYGLNVSTAEKAQLELYYRNLNRTRDLGHILKELGDDWGGYVANDEKKGEEKGGYKKVEHEFDKKQKAFEVKLDLASRALQEAINGLKDGESLYLETGLEGHSMQLVIKKEGSNVKLSTYDSSGALENTALRRGGIRALRDTNKNIFRIIGDFFRSLVGLFRLVRMGNESMGKNALTFSIPQERLQDATGLDYLSKLVRSNSMAGWAQTHIDLQLKHSTMEERSHMGYFERLRALDAQSEVYANYLKNFSSISAEDAPPEFQELLQRPQNTQNCFAKKAQSCELYELGKSTYKKVRLAMLVEQKEGILNDVCGKKGAQQSEHAPRFVSAEYKEMLRSLEPEYLSPAELYEVSMRLCELKKPPTNEYYQAYFNALLAVKEQLVREQKSENQPAIDRINAKIFTHAQDLYLYLQKSRPEDIDKYFISSVINQDPAIWTSGVMPLKTDEQGKVAPKALEKLSEHANALAWKASIQLINHQIKKLSVKERHIHSERERLSHASSWNARHVTIKELEDANVVTFTSGGARKEYIKIELMVGGIRKEIDKATFFNLVVKNRESLTNSKVVGLLDFLRNASPALEQRYTKIVSAAQRQAFVDKLAVTVEQATTSLKSTIVRLSENQEKLTQMIGQLHIIINSITQEIDEEQRTIGKGKNSVKLKNMEARLGLLRKEGKELENLRDSVTRKIENLKGDYTVAGAAENRIAKAKDTLERLKARTSNLQTINQISHAFTAAAQEIEMVHQHLQTAMKTFEVDEVEHEANERVTEINRFRARIISHHLETNAAYRILDDLSAGRIGTEKHRNRDLYTQSPLERAEFFKQGKSSFLPGSVFQEIQSLNQKLKTKVIEIVERKVILSTNTYDASTLDLLHSGNDEYIKIDTHAERISKQAIAGEIKKEWVRKLFALWLKHENPEKLHHIQASASELTAAINHAFHHFLTQKANIKYAALQQAGYPIDLTTSQTLEFGWKPIDIDAIREKHKEAVAVVATKFKAAKRKEANVLIAKPKVDTLAAVPSQLKSKDLERQHEAATFARFVPPNMEFLSLYQRTVIDGSTLKFLRENPMPTLKGDGGKEECAHYFRAVSVYLNKLKTFNGLENRSERISEFCHSAASTIFNLSYPSAPELITEIATSMLERYAADDEDESLNEAFTKLENMQRTQLLTNLIKLNLSQIDVAIDAKVNPKFFSIIKQWEKLIIPRDEAISAKISLLTPDGTKPVDSTLLTKVERALHDSPVSLEGLYEGQKGLQRALTAYGKEKAVDAKLRKLAERLGMRNGDALLAHQFITYYANKQFLLSRDGINSTQGREFFDRALLDAFRNATTEKEKRELLNFLKTLTFNQRKNPCALKVSHEVFIEDVLLKCANIDPRAFKAITTTDSPSTTEADNFVDSLTKDNPLTPKKLDATDRLFGFAKDVNLCALKIENEQNKKIVDQVKIDALYAQFICANLAYQLIFDQAAEDTLANLNKNFEFTREMALVQENINKLQEKLMQFSSNLHENNRAKQFNDIFSKYVDDKKFDGAKVTITAIPTATKDLPGFISLGDNKRLDVLHGVIYLGNNKLGVIPAYIQANIALHELGIEKLPFKPQDGGYIYVEGNDNKIKASITPQKDGSLVIQRELKTLDGRSKMLQYIQPDNMDSLPIALKRRLNAEHYFMDSAGAIHGYTTDFRPILKLAKGQGSDIWSGSLLDYRGQEIFINLDANEEFIAHDLSKIFPIDELIRVDKNTVYVPSIAKFVIYNGQDYFLSDSHRFVDTTSRRHLSVTKEGSAYTVKELSFSEEQEVNALKEQIQQLNTELSQIAGSGLLNSQAKARIVKKIKECRSKIQEITTPEYFVFVAKSPQIIALEEAQINLTKVMHATYKEFQDGGKNRATLAINYDLAKQAYLNGKKALTQAYAEADYLRAYYDTVDGLKAKNLQSILYLGSIDGKTALLTQLLGANVPKLPLKSSELDELRNLKEQFTKLKKAGRFTMEERSALIMLIGVELQHHLLERGACATGKLDTWDRDAYNKLLTVFRDEVNELRNAAQGFPLAQFSELWRVINSEFKEDTLQQFFTKPITTVPTGDKKPLSLNTKTTDMPIESIGARALVQFDLYADPHTLVEAAQRDLANRLHRDLGAFKESVQAQEDGYYYENYGVFNAQTLGKLFNVTSEHAGIGALSKKNVAELFNLMVSEGWIRAVGAEATDKYQIARHPSAFYSAPKIASYLAEKGFARSEIHAISDRLETFLYQTAVSGGTYSIKEGARTELIQKITEAQNQCNIEYLLAQDKIESILADSSPRITFAELNAAYLLNDYSRILAQFPPETDLKQVEIAVNNGMTRLLYYKTELDHFNDVQNTFKMGDTAKAVSMLHIKRNYQLDRLLDSEIALDISATVPIVVEQERKMQRAFLLFESEFGHRCTTRQVNIFRGLLLDDESNPDKIDSAQARMGFGKTTLLPLVALYKTGEKLVRFIVPKSALETNAADMSSTLSNLLGGRAVKDDFQRYRVAVDPQPEMGVDSPRLKSLQNIKEDLRKRRSLYEKVRAEREVLVQAPSVRNSMECQAKIFLDMLLKLNPKETLQRKELMACISLLNEIRSLTTVSIFDELDVTQDSATTDVNYTVGEKIALNPAEIYPLEVIAQTVRRADNRTPAKLAEVLLLKLNINDDDAHSILHYVTSLQAEQPLAVNAANSTQVYLIRAILTDPVMFSIFTEKEPGTDFGVWFQNANDGSKLYDYDALRTGKETASTKPLLITIPYSAANTPKPQGARFDNPEVTAITTFLYYLDPRTEIHELPHLEFLIDSFRSGVGEKPFLDPTGQYIEPEFVVIFNELKKLAEIEDPIFRNAEREKYFAVLDKGAALRRMLARTIIQEQIKFDSGKANSNRYEQGTTQDSVIGFSGTAGDTSSHFKENMLDPAADGNMILGIMGRDNCQTTTSLDTAGFTKAPEGYTTALIKELTASSFLTNSRTLIDVGGLCKISNRAVAREIALQLKDHKEPLLNGLKGVIFYDDVTNMKKVLAVNLQGKETIRPVEKYEKTLHSQ